MYAQTWDTESIFPGGIHSPQLQSRLDQLVSQLTSVNQLLDNWQASDAEQLLTPILDIYQSILAGLHQTGSFANMIQSADAANTEVGPIVGKIYELSTQAAAVTVRLQKNLTAMNQGAFDQLINQDAYQNIAFSLIELRQQGSELLDDRTEALIEKLAIDGFQGWSDHWDTITAGLHFPSADENGAFIQLSAGQAQNKLYENPNPAVRTEMFKTWEKTWADQAPLFADTLNHLAGFRLQVAAAHGTKDYLKQPLELNRMSKQTLDAMWAAVSKHKQPFLDYLKRKAQLMGKEKIGWQDIEAPVIVGDFKPIHYSYDDGAAFIIKNFHQFSPKMADFAKQAFEKRWIEAEDRPGKRPGGYMTELPETGESRIFMTYSGSPSGVATLAHELGHGFHGSVVKDLPILRQEYAMNVAETASTFAELVVADATVRDADSIPAKINLLDQKMSNPLAMFLNIHARYLFESSYYDQRLNGVLTPEQISELMLKAQKTAYNDSLSSYHPHFWSSKLHFYISDVPFYNFPYTFGYLFSAGIYAQSQNNSNFEDAYIALLRDTANMSAEALAQKHLGVDLTKPDFWESGIAMAAADAQEFIKLTDAYVN